jgi:23S rRNA G2069 N7-methylase RlmK/C1962 C5-methylase RlmI
MILDVCCGSKMFYFDKANPDVIFGDIRKEQHILCDGRKLVISPDVIFDFRNLPFKSGQFNQVIFDPPHLEKGGKNAWQVLKYGKLSQDWREDLTQGFKEAFRVLSENGALIFKWNETQILLSEILKLTDKKPTIGHRSGKQSKTHWLLFIK